MYSEVGVTMETVPNKQTESYNCFSTCSPTAGLTLGRQDMIAAFVVVNLAGEPVFHSLLPSCLKKELQSPSSTIQGRIGFPH